MPLTTLPFAFTQDELLTSRDFVRRARDHDFRLDEPTLQALHAARQLLPLFRVTDTAVEGRRVIGLPAFQWSMSPRGWVLEAAEEGRLRDPETEGFGADTPYARPPGELRSRWWNGFVYSSWQLLDLPELAVVLARRRITRGGAADDRARVTVTRPASTRLVLRRRARTLALTVLANRYLPSVLRRSRLPAGEDWEAWQGSRFTPQAWNVLEAVGVEPDDLRGLAEDLLLAAHSGDPIRGWLPLVRHMSSSAWDRLRGPALTAAWQRIAAEVLLQAHEELADTGEVAELPDLAGSRMWHPLADRIGLNDKAEPLEAALSRFGLSPHPRVVLLVEGETEKLHFTRLLRLAGFDNPDVVRVQSLGGAGTNPTLLASYAVSPRVGSQHRDGWELAVPPTALRIVTDPEGRWSTPEKRDAAVASIKEKIRADVARQGANVSDAVLDLLVSARVWSQGCYEVENFSDDELVVALRRIATTKGLPESETQQWRARVETELGRVRALRLNVDHALRHARASKAELAEALWPALEVRATAEFTGRPTTPAVEVVADAIALAARMHRGTVLLPAPGHED